MEADCKSAGSAYGGSNPSLPIDNLRFMPYDCLVLGSVAEVVDAPDLKSVGSNPVRVQVSPFLLDNLKIILYDCYAMGA